MCYTKLLWAETFALALNLVSFIAIFNSVFDVV